MANFYCDYILELDKMIQLTEINKKIYPQFCEKDINDFKADIEQDIKNIITQFKEVRESINQCKKSIRKTEEEIEVCKQTLEKWKNQKMKVEEYNSKLQNKMITQSNMINSSLQYFNQIGLRLDVLQLSSGNEENFFGQLVLNFTKLIPSRIVKIHINYEPTSIKILKIEPKDAFIDHLLIQNEFNSIQDDQKLDFKSFIFKLRKKLLANISQTS